MGMLKSKTALLITRNLPPLLGGMERLNRHIALALEESFSLMVIGPIGCKKSLPKSTFVLEVSPRPLWRFLLESGLLTLRVALEKKPWLVMAGSGLTVPFAWLLGRLTSARSAVYLHGLDIVSEHPVYRFIWVPFFRCIDIVIANSQNTAKLARKAGVSCKRLKVINPGVELPSPDADEVKKKVFRKKYALNQRPLLLSVGRLTRRKGLLQFVERVLPAVIKVHPDACLLVIGDEAPDALSGSGTSDGRQLVRLIEKMGISQNFVHLGVCDDATLSSAYNAADVHIFPVVDIPGDVEGFGMVALEAAAHGLPTVAFRVGGVSDAVASGISGYLIEPGDYHSMEKKVLDILDRGPNSISPIDCRQFAAEHTWSAFHVELRRSLGLAKNQMSR